MGEIKTRKDVVQNLYEPDDYQNVMAVLPDIIKQATIKSCQLLEPTIYERKEIMNVIRDFIRKKGRKVYGGTAIDELIKVINPKDGVYDDYCFSDIEFYSPTPIVDAVELTNLLYDKGYKYPVTQEAQHDETYNIHVNFALYCDITYVPARVYAGINTIVIDGIHYVHPHFIFIDQLRIINQPLTAADFKWEKTFTRMYKLLYYYPLEYFDKKIDLDKPLDEIKNYIYDIKNNFMTLPEISERCLITGFEAYNFFVRHAIQDKNVEKMARNTGNVKNLVKLLVNTPYLEIMTVTYIDTVIKIYNYIKNIVIDPKLIGIEEYFPLFQFTGYSTIITYDGNPIVRVYEADGYCIPNIKTSKGYMYVSYQYILMFMLINKFRAFLDKNKNMYFNYGVIVSNLVHIRNIYLANNNLGVINNTVFGEFRISCIGTTVSYARTSRLRMIEMRKKGKHKFRYEPETFFSLDKEVQSKFEPSKHYFRNTSGNKIFNDKNLFFKIDNDGNIVDNNYETEYITTENTTTENTSESE